MAHTDSNNLRKSTSNAEQLVAQARQTGQNDDSIKKELAGRGYQVKQVERLLVQPSVKPTAKIRPPIIEAKSVYKYFGKIKALKNINMKIAPGKITALLGPNGAGKTTLVQIMATLQKADQGQVIVAGIDVDKNPQKLRSLIGLAGQYAAVDEKLSGRENLEIFGRLYHLGIKKSRARATELLKEFELNHAANRVLKTYSGGMRRRLDLAASLIIKPKVLFLDEPTTGLDPRSRFAMWNIIRELTAGGTTVLLTTQYLEEADQLADKIFVIDKGRIISQGTPLELKNRAGGEILEVHLARPDLVKKAADILSPLVKEKPHVNQATGILTAPLQGGPSTLVDAVRLLDQEKMEIIDIMLRRPTLDDVFLKLTSHTPEQ